MPTVAPRDGDARVKSGHHHSLPGGRLLAARAAWFPCNDLSDAGDYGELVPPSIEPGLVDRLIAAVLAGDVQPLIDERLERDVTLQPVRLLGEIERLVGMNGAQDTGMQLL